MIKLASESLIVISGLKPGIAAARVLRNTRQEEYQMFDCKVELTATKMFEMFAESIPGSILQIYALLRRGKADGKTTQKVLSVVFSAISTGMVRANEASTKMVLGRGLMCNNRPSVFRH